MGVVVIMNSASGPEGDGVSADDVREAFAAARIPAEVESVPPRAIDGRLREVVARAPEALVVGGGDGTISAAAGLLANTGIPFGVLPLGTVNMLARELGLPLDPLEACRTVAAERPRAIDLAQVNDRIYVNHASIGIYPRIAHARQEQILKLQRGRFRATLSAFYQVFRRYPLLDVCLESEGVRLDRKTPFLFVGNDAYEFDRFSAFRRPDLTRGELGIYASFQTGRLDLLWLALRALFGKLRATEDFQLWRRSELRLRTRRRRLKMVVDGELVRMRPPLVYRSLPGALQVLAPRAGGGVVPAAKAVAGGT